MHKRGRSKEFRLLVQLSSLQIRPGQSNSVLWYVGIGACCIERLLYDVQEVEPGRWRWNIHPDNRTVQGPRNFRSRELAIEACHSEINDGVERTRRQGRRQARRRSVIAECFYSPSAIRICPALVISKPSSVRRI